MTGSDLTTVKLGFVPLVDCAIPVVARELGFAREEGIDLTLEREASWAAVRDKLAFGVLDAAHILAGLPIAMTLGLGGIPPVAMTVPMALGLGGNGITVSAALYQRMCDAEPEVMRGPRGLSARALKPVIEADRAAGRPLLSFAAVFPFSSHTYELRYWLAAAGIDPDQDVNLGIVAPPRMVENLRMGWIDGYCVGEPWNLRAVEQRLGVVVATKSDIWANSPEKMLGLRTEWAEANPETLSALVRALVRAARWADEPGNRAELATLLAHGRHVGAPLEVLRSALEGRPVLRPGGPEEERAHHVFFRWQATFPWTSRAVWLMTQMARWGQLDRDLDMRTAAAWIFRPDLYRAAVAPLGLPVPADDGRAAGVEPGPHAVPAAGGGTVELGPDTFLDGRPFDPARPVDYVRDLGS